MNPEIIPALMPQSLFDIGPAALSVRHAVQTVQLDLMDGIYVPETTWPFTTGGAHDMLEINKGDFNLPLWEEVNYELDLMVSRPEEQLDTWLSFGASRIIFHMNSIHDWEKISQIDHVVRNFLEIGVAVTVHDNLEKLYALIDEGFVDFVQCMGIAHIGYQGEPFEAKVIDIIGQIKQAYPKIVISVDGAVNEDTIALLYEAGAQRFVSGSAVFGHGIADENVGRLYSLIEE